MFFDELKFLVCTGKCRLSVGENILHRETRYIGNLLQVGGSSTEDSLSRTEPFGEFAYTTLPHFPKKRQSYEISVFVGHAYCFRRIRSQE